MQTMKKNLSVGDTAEYLARAQELRDLGIEIEIPPEWERRVRTFTIEIASPPDSTIRELPGGRIVYDLGVRLISLRSGVILTRCSIHTLWDNRIWLESFESETGKYFQFGGMQYLRQEVLNERLENSLRFHRRGNRIEGRILGCGLSQIPSELRNGAIVPVQLMLLDQYGHESIAEETIQILRCAKNPIKAGRPSSLFELEDQPKVASSDAPGPRVPTPGFLASVSSGRKVAAEYLPTPNVRKGSVPK